EASGKSLGLGLSFGVNIADYTTATRMDGGAGIGAADDVTLAATSDYQMATLAKSGAKSGGEGRSVAGSVALSVSLNDTISEILAGDGTIELDGNLAVTATSLAQMRTESDADTKGGEAGFGIAIALGWLQDGTRATLDRDVSAGAAQADDVTVSAIAGATAATVASGSATGARKDGETDSTTADQETNKQTDLAKQSSGDNSLTSPTAGNQVASANTTAGDQTSNPGGQGGTAQNASSQQQGGTVRVAGAIGASVMRQQVASSVEDGVTIDASGALDVRATSDADAATLATGLAYAKDAKTGVSAAVAVNYAELSNSATIGDGVTITAGAVNVEAGSTAGQSNDFLNMAFAGGGAAQEEDKQGGQQGEGGGTTAVAGAVGVNVVFSDTDAHIGNALVTANAGDISVT
ncbi:MAG: hypothetical protein JNJ60_20415, partial [Rhodocyclaceae bacterium]|nr:hypothetical protein [Rhodocyclaceae bacterium]